MNITFGVQPDAVNVKIVSGGSTVFDDTYEMSAISISKKRRRCNNGNCQVVKPPTAIIAAKRHITSIQRLPPSRYSISERVSVLPGDFVTVTGFNATEAANVKFSSTPDIGFTPCFSGMALCQGTYTVDVNIPEIANVR